MTTQFLNGSAVRRFCRLRGRRLSTEYLRLLDLHLHRKLTEACEVRNASRKTLDAAVATFTGITK